MAQPLLHKLVSAPRGPDLQARIRGLPEPSYLGQACFMTIQPLNSQIMSLIRGDNRFPFPVRAPLRCHEIPGRYQGPADLLALSTRDHHDVLQQDVDRKN